MTYHPIIIVDSGILVAYYSVKDRYHQQVRVFFERCKNWIVNCQILPDRARSKKPGFFLSLRLSPNILAKTGFMATHRIMLK